MIFIIWISLCTTKPFQPNETLASDLTGKQPMKLCKFSDVQTDDVQTENEEQGGGVKFSMWGDFSSGYELSVSMFYRSRALYPLVHVYKWEGYSGTTCIMSLSHGTLEYGIIYGAIVKFWLCPLPLHIIPPCSPLLQLCPELLNLHRLKSKYCTNSIFAAL